MTSDPPRPTTVQLHVFIGTLACSCGHAINVDGPIGAIPCPRCGQVWTIKATIKPISRRAPEPDDRAG
jgi:hypothetical protein